MSDSAVSERFREALRLAEDGIALMLQNLRRRHVGESEEQIADRLDAWLCDRPMDSPGRVVDGSLP
jgi:hypothetical protein